MKYYKFKINPLICCMAEGMGDASGGNIGDPGSGDSSSDGFGQSGGNSDPSTFDSTFTGYGYGLDNGNMQGALPADVAAIISAGLSSSDLAALAADSFSKGDIISSFSFAFAANFADTSTAESIAQTIAGSVIPGFSIGMLGMNALAIGFTMATGELPAPGTDMGAIGDTEGEKTLYEWLQDPDYIAQMGELYPDLDLTNLQNEMASDMDYLMASLSVGERPEGEGMETYEYDQQVANLTNEWSVARQQGGAVTPGMEKDTDSYSDWLRDYVDNGTVPEWLTDVTEADTVDIGGTNVGNDDFKTYFDTANTETLKTDMTTLGVDNEGLQNAVNTAYGTSYTPEEVTAFLDQDKSYTDFLASTNPSNLTPTISEGTDLDFGNGILMQKKETDDSNGILQSGR